MTDVIWIKIATAIFDDEKIRLIESMPEADSLIVIWIKLLTMAGKQNAGGFIFLSDTIPYTDEVLATILARPLDTVRLALQTFKKFGMIDHDENGFMYLPNWDKHQNIDALEKIREQNRLRKQRQRQRQKEALEKTKEPVKEIKVLPPPPTQSESRRKAVIKKGNFEAFWDKYPKKRSKGDAEKAWSELNLTEKAEEEILLGLEKAIRSSDWREQDGRFIPYPANWLRARGWEDEYDNQISSSGGSTVPI